MRTLTLRLVLVLALLLAGASAVVAQSVTNLRLSASADGAHAATTFPEGTTSLYAVFSYSDFSNQRVAVTVEGRGITDLSTVSQRFTGSDRGSLELSGAMFYKSVSARLLQEARAAQESINRASTASVGLQEYLQQALAGVYSMRSLLLYLGDVPASEALLSDIASAHVAVQTVDALVSDALALPPTDIEGQHAKALAAKPFMGAVVVSARQIQGSAASMTVARIAANTPDTPYTVQLQIEGSPSSSVDFVIAPDYRVYLPYTALRAIRR